MSYVQEGYYDHMKIIRFTHIGLDHTTAAQRPPYSPLPGSLAIEYPPMEISLDHIYEEETAIAIVLIFILGFVRVVLLVEVVLWRVGVLLSSDTPQIWQIFLLVVASFDI